MAFDRSRHNSHSRLHSRAKILRFHCADPTNRHKTVEQKLQNNFFKKKKSQSSTAIASNRASSTPKAICNKKLDNFKMTTLKVQKPQNRLLISIKQNIRIQKFVRQMPGGEESCQYRQKNQQDGHPSQRTFGQFPYCRPL